MASSGNCGMMMGRGRLWAGAVDAIVRSAGTGTTALTEGEALTGAG